MRPSSGGHRRYVRLTVVKASEDWVPSRAARVLEFQVIRQTAGEQSLDIRCPNMVGTASSGEKTLPEIFKDGVGTWQSSEEGNEHWIQADLLRPTAVSRMLVSQAGRPAAVQVQGSPNGEEWTDLASAGAQAEQELSFPGASFRYYRLRFTGDGGVAVSRWRLFTGEAQEILLSQGKTATSSGDTPGYEASKAVDGSWNAWDSVWISADAAAPHWLMVDLGESPDLPGIPALYLRRRGLGRALVPAPGLPGAGERRCRRLADGVGRPV